MAQNPHAPAFDRALNDFKKGLKKRDQDNFKNTSIEGLKQCIGDIQNSQHVSRRMRNLNRLQPFLEAMEQYGKVITIFANTNEIIAYVWGPIKFLLQIASNLAEAFEELINTYERIGEILPLMGQYEQLFRKNPHMVRVLTLMYEDILDFHRNALRYFQQPLWKQLFDATWKTYKSKFGRTISNLSHHRGLIESQASIAHIEETQQQRMLDNDRWEAQLQDEEQQKLKTVNRWLNAARIEDDHSDFWKLRGEYPGTGQWLLSHPTFVAWFNPQFPNVPPLLWLNGIPGAGKTILASLVIDEARQVSFAPTVVYFYCKHENSERNNFLSLARTILAQLLRQDHGMLHYIHKKCCESEAALNSVALAEELLAFAFGNCKSAYIILDGLDECPRNERKYISQWFRKLVEDLPTNEAERIRCLFVSQDDGPARKDFSGLSKISITPNDNQRDIEEYCRVRSEQLKESLDLDDDKAKEISDRLSSSANGMFLFADLVWRNLLDQTTLCGLEEELDPGRFPVELNDAYERIMFRMRQQSSESRWSDISNLLSWLVCAKRSLKWYEIQGMQSINLDEQAIDHDGRRFRVGPQDLCASLVKDCTGGRLEFVHLTAKLFLAEQGYVDPPKEELRLANLCVDYLNLPAVVDDPSEGNVRSGAYGFLDYAALYWVRHLEAGLSKITEDSTLIADLKESLATFLDIHWASPSAKIIISKRNSDRLKALGDFDFYEQLELATVSTRKQITFFGKMEKEEIALDIGDTVIRIRKTLEVLISSVLDQETRNDLTLKYGENLYKCPRMSCQSFTSGFASGEDRDRHVDKHERPFNCTESACPSFTFGFPSASERDKHMRDTHNAGRNDDEEFPTDQEVLQALQPQPVPDPEPLPAPVVVQDPEPEQEPEIVSVQPRSRQKQARQELRCTYCQKLFTKKYNLTSHLKTHTNERPYSCSICGHGFARTSDLDRHKKKHSEKQYRCGGLLRDGTEWGCGKSFSRLDILKEHHKSQAGQRCCE